MSDDAVNPEVDQGPVGIQFSWFRFFVFVLLIVLVLIIGRFTRAEVAEVIFVVAAGVILLANVMRGSRRRNVEGDEFSDPLGILYVGGDFGVDGGGGSGEGC